MGGKLIREMQIVNERGLHARAAGTIVQLCETFDARVEIRFNGEWADAESMMDLMSLAATQGAVITAEAEGPEAEAALEALTELVATRFGEKR